MTSSDPATTPTATNDFGDPVFTDADTAERWLGDHETRALGCGECMTVCFDTGAFDCCGTDQAVPLTLRQGAWRRAAPWSLIPAHRHPEPSDRSENVA